MKQIIYQFFLNLSLLLLSFSLLINSHKLTALLMMINIRKIKLIKSKTSNKKKVLVFPKSGGNEDLIETYYNQKKINITYYTLERIFLKKIFHHHFKNTNKSKIHSDYHTKPINSIESERKKTNIQFLTNVFRIIDYFFEFDGFISFNIFYYNEKYLEEVIKILNKKYIILHKESTFVPIAEKKFLNVYANKNEKSLSHKISVYSESQKKMLIKSKIANKKQVQVNGCPRSDYLFRLRKKRPQNKLIIFYLIEEVHQSYKYIYAKKNSWKKLQDQTLKYLLRFAKDNPDLKIFLKGKTGVHKKKHFNLKIFPSNFSFIEGGPGEKYLRDAKVVIAFGSSVIFEAIASNRNLIIPNFNNEFPKKKEFIHDIKNKKYFINSKDQFIKKLKVYLSSKYMNKQLSAADKRTLEYYLGNTDGKSGLRMRKFLNLSIN